MCVLKIKCASAVTTTATCPVTQVVLINLSLVSKQVLVFFASVVNHCQHFYPYGSHHLTQGNDTETALTVENKATEPRVIFLTELHKVFKKL